MPNPNRNATFIALLCSLPLCGVLVSGCGLGSPDTTAAAITVTSFSGKVMGGPNPIVNATVTAYTTGNSSGTSTGYSVGTAREVWVANEGVTGASGTTGQTGTVLQIIGTAAPRWPELSLGLTGEPQ
jgi:hypothetical protein